MEHFRQTRREDDLDALLEELHQMIGADGEDDGLPDDPLAEIGAHRAPQQPWQADAYAAPEERQEAEAPPVYVDEPQEPSFRVYNNDFADKGMQHTRRRQTQAQKAAQAQLLREARMAQQLREERLRQEELLQVEPEEEEEERPRRKRRGCGCGLTLLLILLLLMALTFGAVKLLGRLPEGGLRDRKAGISNVLVAGVDADGLRTDTLMLVSIDKDRQQFHILSIPRDTLTYGEYAVPKINGAYGYYGCGEAGMEAVMELVQDCIGFRPDKYVLVDFAAVSEFTDLMGGIECEVPMDLEVEGVSIPAGHQRLNGEEVLALLRFRSGYAMADLQRVEVQRQVISAAMEQWLSLRSIPKLKDAIACIRENMMTDLSIWNLASLALDLRGCTAGTTATLPGEAKMIGDGSYYVLNPAKVAELINAHFNPFTKDITVEDLHIKVG